MTAVSWQTFRTRYESEYASEFRPKTQLSIRSALNMAEKLLSPTTPGDLMDLGVFYKAAKEKGLKSTSIRTYCKKLKVALDWAGRQHWVRGKVQQPDVPTKVLRKLPKEPLTDEQLSVLFAAADALDASTAMLIRGLAYSGMRISEAEDLRWDRGVFRMNLANRTFVVDALGDKAGRDRIVPMTVEFRDLVTQVSPDERSGYVFLPQCEDRSELRQLVLKVGLAVKPSLGRRATPHDYRRTFASKWAMKVQPFILQKMLRHDSLTTTMLFYVNVQAEEASKAIEGLRVFG
jgi:integrase